MKFKNNIYSNIYIWYVIIHFKPTSIVNDYPPYDITYSKPIYIVKYFILKDILNQYLFWSIASGETLSIVKHYSFFFYCLHKSKSPLGPGVYLLREKETSKEENGKIEKERHENNKKEKDNE